MGININDNPHIVLGLVNGLLGMVVALTTRITLLVLLHSFRLKIQ